MLLKVIVLVPPAPTVVVAIESKALAVNKWPEICDA